MTLTAPQIFGLQVGFGLLIGFWFLWWSAYQQSDPQPRRWLDTYLVMILAGIVGARVGYILLNPDYFRELPSYIPRLWYAELNWQGTVVGGVLALWLMSRLRKIDLPAFLDGLALALPVIFISVWWGCRSAGCGLAAAVREVDDYPVWLVGYLRDPQGFADPRYELQILGIALGLLVFIIIGWSALNYQFSGKRFWIVLALLGAAMLPLEYWQASKDHRDLDLFSAVLLMIVGIMGVYGSAKRRANVVSTLQQDRL